MRLQSSDDLLPIRIVNNKNQNKFLLNQYLNWK